MATTRDIIRYNICLCADAIRNIKQSSKPYINPGDQAWGRYFHLKREASIWLTAMSLVKTTDGDRAEVRVHASTHNRKVIFRAATKRLQRIASRLSKDPSKYANVDSWVAAKQKAQEVAP